MFVSAFFLLTLFLWTDAEEAPDYDAMTLEELCMKYDAISDRMADESLAAMPMPGGDVEERVAALSKYNATKAELRAVTKALGLRECPEVGEDFEALIEE